MCKNIEQLAEKKVRKKNQRVKKRNCNRHSNAACNFIHILALNAALYSEWPFLWCESFQKRIFFWIFFLSNVSRFVIFSKTQAKLNKRRIYHFNDHQQGENHWIEKIWSKEENSIQCAHKNIFYLLNFDG